MKMPDLPSTSPSPVVEPLRAAYTPEEVEDENDDDVVDLDSGYTVDHLSAVMRPVMLTMVLAR